MVCVFCSFITLNRLFTHAKTVVYFEKNICIQTIFDLYTDFGHNNLGVSKFILY